MQDKYAIGPVTIVQLVGLQAKPKITSVQADGTVRAADPVPQSAAVGFGNDISIPIDEIVAGSHNLKVTASLGLVTSPMGARIALEAGADRPVVDANAPAPAIDPSAFDLLLQKLGLTLPSINDRTTPSTVTTSPDAIAPAITDTNRPPSDGGVTTSTPTAADLSDDVAIFDAPFDGAESFGDDRILDFAIMVDEGSFQPNAMIAPGGAGEYDHMLIVTITTDWTADIIDISANALPDPQASDHFAPNETAHSSSDAIPPI